MVKDIVIRPARQSDLDFFYPKGRRSTCRAFVVEADGRLAALAGVASGLTMVTFSSINPEIEASPRQVWATAKEVFQKIKELGYNNLYAVADPARPSAGKFLERLGFEHVETSAVGEVYLWKWH